MERRKKVFASLLTGFLLLAVSVSVRAAINRGNIEGHLAANPLTGEGAGGGGRSPTRRGQWFRG